MRPPRSFPQPSRRARTPTSVWEWAQAALLVALLAWTTLRLGGFRPETRIVADVLVAILVAVHAIACIATPLVRPVHPAGWLVLPFLAYAAANAAWITPVPWLGWAEWAEWAQMAIVFWVALNGLHAPGPRRAVFGGLVALAVVAVGLACYQRFVRPDWLMLGRTQVAAFVGRASGPFGIPSSLAGFLILLLPAVGALACRPRAGAVARVGWGWLAGVLGVGLLLTLSRGAWLSLALAFVAWPLLGQRGRWRGRATGAVIVLALVVAAGAILFAASPKARERVALLVEQRGELTRPVMWEAAWRLFKEEPLWGTGAASFNVLFEKHRPERFPVEPQWAHNDYLNTLGDYGAAGFVLLFGAVAAIAWRSGRGVAREEGDRLESPLVASALGVGLLAFAVQLGVDFHLRIPALAFAFATVGGLFVGHAWPAGHPRPAGAPWRGAHGAAGIGIAALALLVWRPQHEAEALRYNARQSVDRLAAIAPSADAYRAPLMSARRVFARAVEIDPRNAQAWADLAYATALYAHVEPARGAELGREAEAAADRALAIAPVPYEFWVRRAVARDLQGRWLEAGNDTAEAVGCAPCNAQAWYHQAYHFSLRGSERRLAEAALAFCLRLDPYNAQGVALRQHLAAGPVP